MHVFPGKLQLKEQEKYATEETNAYSNKYNLLN